MGYRGERITYPSPVLGIWDQPSIQNIPPGYCLDANNVRVFQKKLWSRKGTERIGDNLSISASQVVIGGFEFIGPSLRTGLALLTGAGNGLFKVSVAGVWTDRTGAVVLTTDTSKRLSSCMFMAAAGGMYSLHTDQENMPFYWDGNTANNAVPFVYANQPTAVRHLFAYGSRVVAINFTDDAAVVRQNGVTWSGINDFSSWNSSGSRLQIIQTNEASALMAYGFLEETVILFFENAIYELILTDNDTTPFFVRPYLDGKGTTAHNAVSVDGDVYFWDKSGPWSTGKSGKIRFLGEGIRNFIYSLSAADRTKFQGAYSSAENVIYWVTSINASFSKMLIYDIVSGGWTFDTYTSADCRAVFPYALDVAICQDKAIQTIVSTNTGLGDIVDGSAAAIASSVDTGYLPLVSDSSGSSNKKILDQLRLETNFYALTPVSGNSLAATYRRSQTATLSENLSLSIDGDTTGVGSDDHSVEAYSILNGDTPSVRFRFSATTGLFFRTLFGDLTVAFKPTRSL